jgi:hypothetical protein
MNIRKGGGRRRRLLFAAGFLVLGLVFGFVSLALGPLGLIESLIVLGLVLVQVRRMPERSGAYLVGFSILPVIVLASIVFRLPACHPPITSTAPQCYAPLAVPALIAYAAAGVIGALLFGRALRRL